jgi:dTDP-4-dehydrorhamnose reductase
MGKTLLVGADGGLGKAFLEALRGASRPVDALGRADLDVSRRNDVFDRVRASRPDVVISCAAYTDVDGCEIDKWRAYLVNRDGAEHVARAAAEVGALVVYPSCDLVFDGARTTPYREEDSPNPLSIYGDTKLGAELCVMKHALKHLIVRSGPLFGPGGTGLFAELVHRWRAGEKGCSAVEEGRGQPTFRADFVKAVLALVDKGQTGLWHAAPPDDATPHEFAREAWKALGCDPGQVRALRRSAVAATALRPRYSVLDVAKAARAGVVLRSWKDALKAAVSELA